MGLWAGPRPLGPSVPSLQGVGKPGPSLGWRGAKAPQTRATLGSHEALPQGGGSTQALRQGPVAVPSTPGSSGNLALPAGTLCGRRRQKLPWGPQQQC